MTHEHVHDPIDENFAKRPLPFRIVLAMQGGGALGAYYGGVYEALQARGLEPDWIIGTSIGAINGAILAGNPPERRVAQLRAFWDETARGSLGAWSFLSPFLGPEAGKYLALTAGVPGFYAPNTALALGWRAPVGLERSALFSTAPLRENLAARIDFAQLNSGRPRFSFNLVHILHGTLHYFDNREGEIRLEHVLAAGAMPPSFPAVRIDGEPYWDAGFYCNTPLATAFQDKSGCNSIIFAPNLWTTAGDEPRSLAEAWSRQKTISFASRADDEIARQVQLHRLHHAVRHLISMLPDDKRETLRARNFERRFLDDGGGALVHLVQLHAHASDGSDPLRDIDFTEAAVRERWDAGFADTCRVIDRRFWEEPVAIVNGVAVHNSEPSATN